MGAAYFYHLTRQPLEVALPALLEKASGASWRVEVRGTSLERMQWLDDKLWLGPDDGFLAHGLHFGPDHPIVTACSPAGRESSQRAGQLPLCNTHLDDLWPGV